MSGVTFLAGFTRFDSGRDPTKRCFEGFLGRINAMKSPRILELGSRNISRRDLFVSAGEHVGFDINAGPQVDKVGDIHDLSSHFPAESFDAVYCVSVFEHLAMPWKAALEINKVMRPGGLLFIFTHPTFPSHAQPWDFWRFSRSAFLALFNEKTGFAIEECVEGLPCAIVSLETEKGTRGANRALSFMGIALIARKNGQPSSNLRWDLPSEGLIKDGYPLDYTDEATGSFFQYLENMSPGGSRG